MASQAGTSWRKSRRSGSNPYGNCVEVCELPAESDLTEAEHDMLKLAKAVGVTR